MSLPVNHPTLKSERIQISTTSIGATPVACYASIPFRCVIAKIGCVAQGAITTADCTVTVAVNGTTNANLAFTVPVASAAAGQIAVATPLTRVALNEDDVITLTPSGASGASIGGNFFFDCVAS